MATDLDRFVLLYKADTAEAQKKLDQLNEKLGRVGKSTKESTGGVKALAGELTSAAARAVGVGLSIAGAMALVVKSIRAATEAAKDYNEQMLIARATGLGSLGQEAVALNFARASGGYMTRAMSRSTVNQIGSTVNAAYTDPTRMNSENIRLRMMGVSPVGANGNVNSAENVMNQLGKRWKKMTEEMADAEGQLLGLTPQATEAIRSLGGAVADTSNMSLLAIQRQSEASEAAKKFNSAINGITEDLKTMSKVLIDESMKSLATFFEKIHSGTSELAKSVQNQGVWETTKHVGRFLNENLGQRLFNGKGDADDMDIWRQTSNDKPDTPAEDAEKRRLVEKQNDAAQKQHEAAQKQILTANQFAMAVSAMPGSLSMQEAIAMWAGAAYGGGSSGGANGSRGGSVSGGAGGTASPGAGGAVEFFMSKGWSKAQATGIAANLQKESNFDPGAIGDGGKAYGVAQWHPDRQAAFKRVFGKDIRGSTAAEQYAFVDWELRNTEKGAGDALGRSTEAGHAAGVVSSLYERPANRAGEMASRGAAARAMYGSGGGVGFSRSDAQTMMAARGLASQVPSLRAEQIMRGDAAGGDVKFAFDKQRFGIGQEIMKLQNEAEGYKAAGKPQMAEQTQRKLVEMKQQLTYLDQYGPSLVAKQKDATSNPGTQGMPAPINININGAQDPAVIAAEVKKVLQEEAAKAVNGSASKTVS